MQGIDPAARQNSCNFNLSCSFFLETVRLV